jgi:hypothetical protein
MRRTHRDGNQPTKGIPGQGAPCPYVASTIVYDPTRFVAGKRLSYDDISVTFASLYANTLKRAVDYQVK